MGTYAQYYRWVGVLLKDLSEDDRENEFVQKVLESLGLVDEKRGISFTSIHMHGETVGIGVMLVDLSWTTTEKGPTEYDPLALPLAHRTRVRVNSIFKEKGIAAEAKLYHHIDLGG